MQPELTLIPLDSVLTIAEPLCPFTQYPELRTIWDDPEYTAGAIVATIDWQTNDCHNPGGIWLIKQGAVVIGITGWFLGEDDEAILRWTGIVPSYRKLGLGKRSLALLETALPEGIRYLVEISFSTKSQEWFLQNGFEYVTSDYATTRILATSVIDNDSPDALETPITTRVLFKARTLGYSNGTDCNND